jgi:hypothetical protein
MAVRLSVTRMDLSGRLKEAMNENFGGGKQGRLRSVDALAQAEAYATEGVWAHDEDGVVVAP